MARGRMTFLYGVVSSMVCRNTQFICTGRAKTEFHSGELDVSPRPQGAVGEEALPKVHGLMDSGPVPLRGVFAGPSFTFQVDSTLKSFGLHTSSNT